MQPDAIDILNGVKHIIVNMLLPELQTEQTRQQAMLTTVLLDHVVARWRTEVPLLQEEHAELRAVLTQALAVTPDPRLRETLQASVTTPTTADPLRGANERMRCLLPALHRAVNATGSDAPQQALAAAIQTYLRNQHRRDLKIVEVGALGW